MSLRMLRMNWHSWVITSFSEFSCSLMRMLSWHLELPLNRKHTPIMNVSINSSYPALSVWRIFTIISPSLSLLKYPCTSSRTSFSNPFLKYELSHFLLPLRPHLLLTFFSKINRRNLMVLILTDVCRWSGLLVTSLITCYRNTFSEITLYSTRGSSMVRPSSSRGIVAMLDLQSKSQQSSTSSLSSSSAICLILSVLRMRLITDYSRSLTCSCTSSSLSVREWLAFGFNLRLLNSSKKRSSGSSFTSRLLVLSSRS